MSILAIVLFIFLIWLDFALGKRTHQRTTIKKSFPQRQSDCELFNTGERLFSALFNDIKEASHHIHILFYIVREDDISKRLFHLLKEKANQGVTVRLLVDRIGSMNISKATRKDLKDHGIHFSFAKTPTFPYFLYKLNRRNHRKICVIDGKIGFLGGFNVGNEYLGLDPKLGHWRDFHLKITGEGVCDLQQQFLEDWHDATKVKVNAPSYYPKLVSGKIPIKLQPTDGAHVEEIFLELFDKAKYSITIGTPYFIPGKRVQQALISKAKEGVKVTLLLPQKSDHLFVKQAAMPYIKGLLHAGCSIYQFTEGFYHAKVVIIDDELCDIGTANFDRRSFYLNQEMNCFIYDKVFVGKVQQAFSNDIQLSAKVTMETVNNRSLKERIEEKFGTLFARFL
ncbi:cardiolipin synthase [Lottiidibacillus patelloidae]|uniref:Cardiolipin synthase n=1 Tax=Lottiidibacillus patelloidae TaxID=2670334 RepID=A0A263BTB7_9BACI|nr:cardiolipin synthase [Lottiidibacillus patelloidae]